MMKNKYLDLFQRMTILLSVFFVSVTEILANGDPVVNYSALALTCTPEPRRIPEIQLVSEDLVIELGCPMSCVKVKYVLQNTSDKHFDRIDYGFPIDWFGDGEAQILGATFYTMASQEFGWRDSYVQSVRFEIDDQDMPWKCSKDTLLREGLLNKLKDYGDEEMDSLLELYHYKEQIGFCETQKIHNIYRKWYYTSFGFEPKQTRTLTVEYQIAVGYEMYDGWAYSVFKECVDENQKDPEYYGADCRLTYDFRPAAYWGNGKAKDMRVSISSSAQFPIEINGLSMRKDNSSTWIHASKDFDFDKSDPLTITYHTVVRKSEDIEDLRMRKLNEDQFRIIAKGIDLHYMTDYDLKTAGQILPDADGEYWILIQTDGDVDLCGLLIYPGDCSSRERYLQTAHWKSIQIRYEEEYRTVESFFNCHTQKATTMTLQDLTDVAEKYHFSPYYGECCRQVRPKEIWLVISDNEVASGQPLYVSDIVLIGTGLKCGNVIVSVEQSPVGIQKGEKLSGDTLSSDISASNPEGTDQTNVSEEKKSSDVWIILLGILVLSVILALTLKRKSV